MTSHLIFTRFLTIFPELAENCNYFSLGQQINLKIDAVYLHYTLFWMLIFDKVIKFK